MSSIMKKTFVNKTLRTVCAVSLVAVLSQTVIAAPTREKQAQRIVQVPVSAPIGTVTPVVLDVDQADILRLQRAAAQVFVANPDIADIQAPEATTVIVLGKKPGRTTLIALDAAGAEVGRFAVTVRFGSAGLSQRIQQDYPHLDVAVNNVGQNTILSGKTNTPAEAAGIVDLAKAYSTDPAKVIDRLSVTSATQVSLHVYFAEVSRTVMQNLGINLQNSFSAGLGNFGFFTGRQAIDFINKPNVITTLGNGTDTLFGTFRDGRNTVSAVLDLLNTEGLINVLAEPNLTAISGQSASFLSGGEFPIPILQSGSGNNGITVLFKQFGISLNFAPTVLGPDRISINVKPEVSQLSTNGAVNIGGFSIPSLTVRRLETTIELGSGETFAIGGLLQSRLTDQVNKYPGLGDIPVLGKLFQSKMYQNDESELVIFVTPYIVEPSKSTALSIPNRPVKPNSEVEKLMSGPSIVGENPEKDSSPMHLYGQAGFTY